MPVLLHSPERVSILVASARAVSNYVIERFEGFPDSAQLCIVCFFSKELQRAVVRFDDELLALQEASPLLQRMPNCDSFAPSGRV